MGTIKSIDRFYCSLGCLLETDRKGTHATIKPFHHSSITWPQFRDHHTLFEEHDTEIAGAVEEVKNLPAATDLVETLQNWNETLVRTCRRLTPNDALYSIISAAFEYKSATKNSDQFPTTIPVN